MDLIKAKMFRNKIKSNSLKQKAMKMLVLEINITNWVK